MEATFFRQIAGLNFTGNLQLIISKGAGNTLVVSTLLQNGQCGDSAKDFIAPLNLRGTAEELDGAYFDRIAKPMETASGLMDNMEDFLKQLEVAKKQSAMEKQKTDREKKETDAKDRKYQEAMAKADELDRAGDPKQAWMKLPTPADFPEYAEIIRKRRSELSARFAPDLFGQETPEPLLQKTATESQAKFYPHYADNEIEEEMDFGYEEEEEDNY